MENISAYVAAVINLRPEPDLGRALKLPSARRLEDVKNLQS